MTSPARSRPALPVVPLHRLLPVVGALAGVACHDATAPSTPVAPPASAARSLLPVQLAPLAPRWYVQVGYGPLTPAAYGTGDLATIPNWQGVKVFVRAPDVPTLSAMQLTHTVEYICGRWLLPSPEVAQAPVQFPFPAASTPSSFAALTVAALSHTVTGGVPESIQGVDGYVLGVEENFYLATFNDMTKKSCIIPTKGVKGVMYLPHRVLFTLTYTTRGARNLLTTNTVTRALNFTPGE